MIFDVPCPSSRLSSLPVRCCFDGNGSAYQCNVCVAKKEIAEMNPCVAVKPLEGYTPAMLLTGR